MIQRENPECLGVDVRAGADQWRSLAKRTEDLAAFEKRNEAADSIENDEADEHAYVQGGRIRKINDQRCQDGDRSTEIDQSEQSRPDVRTAVRDGTQTNIRILLAWRWKGSVSEFVVHQSKGQYAG